MRKKKAAEDPEATSADSGGSEKSPKKVWSGILQFGLISMPVSLHTATTEERVSFNHLHQTCHGRIKQQLFCPACEVVVPKTELHRGYEFAKNQYVVISDAELTAVEPKSAKLLELSCFVPASQLDPIFFESSYFLVPQEGGEKRYALVRQAMRETNLVGIAHIVRNSREHVCVLRPHGQGMILHTLFWMDEVRSMAYPVLPDTTEAELSMAKQLVKVLASDWNPEQYRDSYRAAVLQLIETKRQGREVTTPSAAVPDTASVIDISAALARSLQALETKRGAA